MHWSIKKKLCLSRRRRWVPIARLPIHPVILWRNKRSCCTCRGGGQGRGMRYMEYIHTTRCLMSSHESAEFAGARFNEPEPGLGSGNTSFEYNCHHFGAKCVQWLSPQQRSINLCDNPIKSVLKARLQAAQRAHFAASRLSITAIT